MPDGPETELERLLRDVRHLGEHARSQEVWRRVADEADLARQSYLLAVSDFFWQIIQHAAAIALLLPENLDGPVLTVHRAIFEASVGLGYLRQHPQREQEAVILFAFTHLKDMQDHASETKMVDEREQILARMPAHVVTEARRRTANRPYTWSGKSLKAMAAAAGVLGYDDLYSPLSGLAHAARTGRYFRIETLPGRVNVYTGREITDVEREIGANFARRMLHAAFRAMLSDLNVERIALETTNPDAWHGLRDDAG